MAGNYGAIPALKPMKVLREGNKGGEKPSECRAGKRKDHNKWAETS